MTVRAQITTRYKFSVYIRVPKTDAKIVSGLYGGRKRDDERFEDGGGDLRSGNCRGVEECPFISAQLSNLYSI